MFGLSYIAVGTARSARRPTCAYGLASLIASATGQVSAASCPPVGSIWCSLGSHLFGSMVGTWSHGSFTFVLRWFLSDDVHRIGRIGTGVEDEHPDGQEDRYHGVLHRYLFHAPIGMDGKVSTNWFRRTRYIRVQVELSNTMGRGRVCAWWKDGYKTCPRQKQDGMDKWMRRWACGGWEKQGEETNDEEPSIRYRPDRSTPALPTIHSTCESNHDNTDDLHATKGRRKHVGHEEVVCTYFYPTRTKTSWKKPPTKVAPGRGFAATTTNHATSSHSQSARDMEHGPGATENAREKANKEAEKLKKGMYRLTFVTGVRRGAGTKARARVVLCGETGKSESFLLGGRDDDAGGFITGSRRVYYVNTSNYLGEIYRVDVELADYSIAEVGCRWFLDQVEVYHELKGQEWIFPCRAWLGELGPPQRSLSPCLAPHLRELPKPDKPLQIVTAAQAYPHPDKVQAGFRASVKRQSGHAGEDAYFVFTKREDCKTHAMGVADGVYMWRESGIDAGEFSRALVMSAYDAVSDGTTDVLGIFRSAAERVKSRSMKGSSTFIVITVDPEEGRLSSANLGDSGFLLLGNNPDTSAIEVKFKSPQQEHEFGFPYQLGHQENSDSPDDAQLAAVPVTAGDILVVGSDGLFDNLPDNDLIEVLQEVQAKHSNRSQAMASALAQAIAAAAFHSSMNKNKATPYSRAATEAFDMVYSGGKRDDITVIVALLN